VTQAQGGKSAVTQHNRRLYPEPLETTAFYDHRDLLPTILDLAGVRDAESYGIGKSIVPVMQDPSKTVQDHTLFSFDDVFFVPPSAPNSHIRAMREGDWTYAAYFSLDGGGGKPPDSAKAGNAGAMAKSMPRRMWNTSSTTSRAIPVR
jgi:arylsulfatase A-like enzyme